MSQTQVGFLIHNIETDHERTRNATTTQKYDSYEESNSPIHYIKTNREGKGKDTTTQEDDSHYLFLEEESQFAINNIDINYEDIDNTTTTEKDGIHDSFNTIEIDDNATTTQEDDFHDTTSLPKESHSLILYPEINRDGKENATTTKNEDFNCLPLQKKSQRLQNARGIQRWEQEEVATPKRKKRKLTMKAGTKKSESEMNTTVRKRKRCENETQVGKTVKKKRRVAKSKLRGVREPNTWKLKTNRKKVPSTTAMVEPIDEIADGVVSISQDKKSPKPARIFRCTFITMAELCKSKPKISPQHQQAIDETPFGPLLNVFLNGTMNEDKVVNKTALINSIIESYSVYDDAFRLGSGKETTLVKLSEQDFALVFGLPVRGTNAVLMFDKWKFNLETQREVIKKYMLGESKKISKAAMKHIIEQLWEKNDTEFDSAHFARMMIMLTCSTIFYPSSNYDIGKSFIEHIDTLEEMKRLSWAKIFHKHLMDKIREVKNNDAKDPASVTSCVLVLLFWLCEHTTLIQPRPTYKPGTPRVGRWDLNELGKIYQHGLLQKLTKEQIRPSFSQPTHEEYLLLQETTDATPLQIASPYQDEEEEQREEENNLDALKEKNGMLIEKIDEIKAQNKKLLLENEELRKQKQVADNEIEELRKQKRVGEEEMSMKIKKLAEELEKFNKHVAEKKHETEIEEKLRKQKKVAEGCN